ncbi:MAG: hypothetical protein AB1752_05670 [Candidatus Zixiibacteriota bacterium]
MNWLQRVWLWVGWLAFGGFALRFVLHFLEPLPAVAFLLTVTAFCFPGWVFLSLLWGGESASHQPELWIWGAALGIAANVWLVIIEGYLTGHATGWSILGLDVLAIIVWFLYARWRGAWTLDLRPWTFGERVLWLVISLWILAFMSHACLPFGRQLADGTMLYPRAFAPDLLAQVSTGTAISLGLPYAPLAMAKANAPLSSGITLLPVVGRGWMDPSGSLSSWVILSNLFVAFGFGGVLVSTLRVFIANLRGLVLAASVISFAYGFYWLIGWVRPDLIVSGSAWTGNLMGVSVYRWMLANPQILLTLALAMIAAAWIATTARPPSRTGMAGFGILAGLISAIDQPNGWLAVVAGIVWVIALLLTHPHDRLRLGMGALLFIAGAFAAIAPISSLGVQTPHPVALLEWSGDWGALFALPGRLGLLFGPLLIFGIWGTVRRVRQGGDLYAVTICLALLLFGVMLLSLFRLDVVSGMPGLVLLAASLMFGLAWLFEGIEFTGGTGRWVVIGVLVLGLPALIADYRIAGPSADLERSIAIHSSDHNAAVWAQEFLPVGAVVQSSPDYRNYAGPDTLGNTGLAWTASLAQRRMMAGPRRLSAGVADSLQRDRRWQVAAMLGSAHPDSLHARARRLGVDYLYVGPAESRRRPLLRARLQGSPGLFESVYEQDSAAIFRVYP